MKRSGWISLILSSLGLFLSSWIVLPAPNMTLLPLAVGAPEISPLLLIGNLIGLVWAGLHASRRHRIALVCSLTAILLSSLPLLQIPDTLQQANAQFRMGNIQAATGLEAQQVSEFRPLRTQPIVWTDLLTGLSIPEIQPDRTSFVTAAGTRLELAIYRPNGAGPHPGIIAIYGGAWQRGDPGQNAQFNAAMAAQGYVVIAIDYRHAPAYRFPAQLEDVQASINWIHQNASIYGLDTTRLAIVGWSAGAHLALLAAYQPPEFAPFRAVVSYYGPIDLIAGYEDPPRPDPIHTRSILEAFLGGTPAQQPERYRAASPITQVRPGLPPTLLIYGSRDHIVKAQFGQALADRLHETGNTVCWISLPWAEHAFDAVFRGLGNQISLYYTERFLSWALQP